MGNERGNIDLSIAQRKLIADLLKRYLPDTEVWAYGSRVKFTSRPNSDLDMVAFVSPEKKHAVSSLKEVFEESDLPFRVDLFVWDDVPKQFHENIETERVVLQQPAEKRVMGSEWKVVQLQNIVSKLGDGLHGTPEYSENGYYYFINGNNLVNGNIVLKNDTKRVSSSEYEKHKKTLNNNTLLVSINGTIGNVAYYNNEPVILGKSACYFNLNEDVSRNFVRYVLSSSGFLHYLESYSTGTTIKNVSLKMMREFSFRLPPLPEQKAIAHILGSLDDKIELNRRMNATLEGMAQALFKSWFVDFDPVIDNALAAGNPIPEELAERAEVRRKALADGAANREAAKQFPAAFQLTEEMGWIPEGWEVKSFAALTKQDTTAVKPFEQPETIWEHYSIPSYDSSGMPRWEKGNDIKSNKYLVKPGAILSSKLNPETERTWWPFMMNKEASICSTEFMQFVPHQKEEQAYVYSLIRSEPFQANMLERVTGSTGSRQRAQPKQIAEIGIIDSGESLRAEYIKVTLPLFQSIRNNSIQSQTLTKLRDTLLPKLISGELRIPEAETLTGETLA